MGEDAVFESGVGEFAQHGDLNLGHDFAAFDAQDGGAKDLFAVRVNDGFHEAAGFIEFECAGDIVHGHFCDADFSSCGAGFSFAHTHAAKLWVDEEGIWEETTCDRSASLFDDVGSNDAEVVVGNVRESGTAFDVAESEDAGDICFETIIDLNVAVLVSRDSGGGRVEPIGVGNAARSDEKMCA